MLCRSKLGQNKTECFVQEEMDFSHFYVEIGNRYGRQMERLVEHPCDGYGIKVKEELIHVQMEFLGLKTT